MGEALNAVSQTAMGVLDPLAKQASQAVGKTPLGKMMGGAMDDPESALGGLGLMGAPAQEAFKTAKKNKNASTLLTGGLNQRY